MRVKSPPIELTPRRATMQSIALLTILYAYLYGNAALRGSASLEESNLVLSSLVTGALMLLVTGLLLRRDANWRASLQAGPIPIPQALAFGAVAVVFAYACGSLVLAAYTAIGPDLKTQAIEKAAWAAKLGTLPLWGVVTVSVVAGVWEEIVFRGFLLNRVKVAFGGDARLAVGLTAVMFGLGHGYQGVTGLLQTTAVGVALGTVTVWRKSLWPAVIAHLSIDTLGLLAIKVLKPVLERMLHH